MCGSTDRAARARLQCRHCLSVPHPPEQSPCSTWLIASLTALSSNSHVWQHRPCSLSVSAVPLLPGRAQLHPLTLPARAQLHEASFGAASAATVSVQNGGWIKGISHSGPGIASNFWTDGNSAWNNYGNGYLAALQAMNVGSLRYPGGEKSDTCAPCRSFAPERPVTASEPVTETYQVLLLGLWPDPAVTQLE